MSRVCQYCGKRTRVGNSIARRGLAKPKGGIGLKTTGVTRRRFKANIQNMRAMVGGSMVRVRICAKCIKSGKISKGVAKRKAAS
ncbi:MAG: 50S ribosomal protein L28 [Planctomycetota bacterium]|jgi:large subunit ribosomal protein L28